jgi:ABC-type sulfate/molybdate transport systems ATPase subunit
MSNFDYQEKETILSIKDLSIAFGDKVIIENINLEEKDIFRNGHLQGQTIAILGRSGRGKSTFFKALTGILKPTTGHILIPDFDKAIVDGTQPAKQVTEGSVGFVDQKYTLFRHKTIEQTFIYALRKSNLNETDKAAKVNEYLNNWGLMAYKDQYPNELSGGQRQRTAIIEQLLSSKTYLVLDEPFSGLDVGNIQNVKEAFKLITSSNELNTILFSTHDIELAVDLADAIYVIGYPTKQDGSLHNVGTICASYDLKKLNLCWKNEFTSEHLALLKDIKQVLLKT